MTKRVSVSSSDKQGNGHTDLPAISANGRFVAFESIANNLIPDDDDEFGDVFVRDLLTGRIERVTLGLQGAPGGGSFAAISRDGRFVAFASGAENLVRGDRNRLVDIFVRDRQTGVAELVSVNSQGAQSNGHSGLNGAWGPAISADGQLVVFGSEATNLVPNDTNSRVDMFLRDRRTGRTKLVSRGPGGVLANGDSAHPAISADGRFVAFTSFATNLVLGDSNDLADIFVHDRATNATERVSVRSGGGQAQGCCDGSTIASLSSDGRFVAFDSTAINLVPRDLNNAVDVFVRDRLLDITERVSLGLGGREGASDSLRPSISADGRFVAFQSFANNLALNDANGIATDIFVRDRLGGTTQLMSRGANGRGANGDSFTGTISANGSTVTFWSAASNLVSCDTNRVRDAFVSYMSYSSSTVVTQCN